MSLLRVAFLAAISIAFTHEDGHAQEGGARACWCFSWVHGADHGTTCRATEAACTRAGRETTRDHTPCSRHREPGACGDDAFIDGAHYRNER